MSREGLGTIVGALIFTIAVTAGAITSGHLYLEIFATISILLTLLFLYFFRDPERQIPADEHSVISPADGRVIEIVEETENEFLKEKATRVSIFLSVLDVHVNRIPVTGRVDYLRYQKGSFVQAFKKEASLINEQSIIGILMADGRKILFKQIAGLLARRIVCDIRTGNAVKRGERFGIIKFGSRVDIFFPKEVEIKVKLKQKVKGGESILGVFT